MVSKMTVARIPPAMTTVPADIRNPLHQQPAGRMSKTRRMGTERRKVKGEDNKEEIMDGEEKIRGGNKGET